MKITDDGRNPLITVSPDEVLVWLRSKADEAGYADRELCAVQAAYRDREPPIFTGYEPPELTLMVSNIKGSRNTHEQKASDPPDGWMADGSWSPGG